MKTFLFYCPVFAISIFLLCCKKNSEPNCVTWTVTYWQGTSSHTTVTSNYTPYDGEKTICGAGKDTVSEGKIVVISQVNNNLFNYLSFNHKK